MEGVVYLSGEGWCIARCYWDCCTYVAFVGAIEGLQGQDSKPVVNYGVSSSGIAKKERFTHTQLPLNPSRKH